MATAEERFIADTQVDASTADKSILVPGRLVGMDLTDGGPHVNGVYVAKGDGRPLSESDAGRPVVLVEQNFADFYHLPPDRTLRVAGNQEVSSVGIGLAPEYFFVTTEEGGFFAEANFAVLFTSMETAQALAGRPGRVNDLVLKLAPGVDPAAAAREIETAFAQSGTGLGVTVKTAQDDGTYRVLYDDIKGDQQFWNILAGLILAGAAFGAFNLASRMVEAERREIGIGMAMGWSRRRLAVRPLLVGAQIAFAGAALGIVMTFVVMAAIRPVFTVDAAPPGVAHAVAAGHVPARRRHRVRAAVPGHRLAGAGGRCGSCPSTPSPPPTPRPAAAWRRCCATCAGPSAPSAACRSATCCALHAGRCSPPSASAPPSPRSSSSSACSTRSTSRWTATRPRCSAQHADRVSVTLDRFVREGGPELAAVAAANSVGAVEPVLRVGATLSTPGHETIPVALDAIDLTSDVWAPTFEKGGLGQDRAGAGAGPQGRRRPRRDGGRHRHRRAPGPSGRRFRRRADPDAGGRHPSQPVPVQRLHRPHAARRLRRSGGGQRGVRATGRRRLRPTTCSGSCSTSPASPRCSPSRCPTKSSRTA